MKGCCHLTASKGLRCPREGSHQHHLILCLWASHTLCCLCCLHDASRSSVSPLLSSPSFRALPSFILLFRPCRVPCIRHELANNIKDKGISGKQSRKMPPPQRVQWHVSRCSGCQVLGWFMSQAGAGRRQRCGPLGSRDCCCCCCLINLLLIVANGILQFPRPSP